jgi:hypothetical protein
MINITREEFYNFIKTNKDTEEYTGKATQHYLAYFDNFTSTGQKKSWNWASFITAFITSFFFSVASIVKGV